MPSVTESSSPFSITELGRTNGYSHPGWSPDGSAFSVVGLTGTLGIGEVVVWRPGRIDPIASWPGYAYGWLDDETVAVYEGDYHVVIHSLDGRDDVRVPGLRVGLLGTGRDRVAYSDPAGDKGAPEAPVYVLANWNSSLAADDPDYWSEVGPFTRVGHPMAWSPDDSILALSKIIESADDTVRLASALGGASGWGDLAAGMPPERLILLRVPDGKLLDVPDLDLEGGFAFSPDGSRLADVMRRPDGVAVIDVGTTRVTTIPGTRSLGWTPDGDLMLSTGDSVELWHPDGTTTATDFPIGRIVWGPTVDQVTVIPLDPTIRSTVSIAVRSGSVSVDIPNVYPGEAAWSPDGTMCLVATDSKSAQEALAQLLLVRTR